MGEGKHLGLRLDDELHFKLRYIAQSESRSINGEVIHLIRKYIAEYEKTHEPIEVDYKQSKPIK